MGRRAIMMAIANIVANAKKIISCTLFGACEQNGTPTPSNPIPIVCNNGTIGVDSQGNVIVTGTKEKVCDSLGNEAEAENLLGVAEYRDEQEVLSGEVIRNVGIIVFDGSENWQDQLSQYNRVHITISKMINVAGRTNDILCTHFQGITSGSGDGLCYHSSQRVYIFTSSETLQDWKVYLAQQYADGTPVILVYPLANPTTKSTTPQVLKKAPITQIDGSIQNLDIVIT